MVSFDYLNATKAKTQAKINPQNHKNGFRVTVGMATCGITAGAGKVFQTLKQLIASNNLNNIDLAPVGCVGECALEPLVEVIDHQGQKTTYCKVSPQDIEKIVNQHLIGGAPVKELTIDNYKNIDSSSLQVRIALRNCGVINPEDINEYICYDGYKALGKALTEMTPEEVIHIIQESGLRGRGGGGFSTGLKWSLCAKNKGGQKYIICNADEGDPGAFMDRAVLEGDPHSVIEAMAIGGYAIGASQGYIYIRAEYPLAVQRLNKAIEQAYEAELLGKNIFGTDFCFDLELRLGAGAFVCGEETALIASIEGERGMPRNKPPFPADKGLFSRPSIINNVETLANIPPIILKGAKWFASMGTQKSKGTKVFALGGKINNTGLLEVPMGTTLRQVIYDVGGGIPNNKKFKAVQTGGPSGGCLTAEHLDTPIDYDNLVKLNSMMGSGGMIVMDEDNCMVDVAHFYLQFTVEESCGKCTPCREGTHKMLEILEKIKSGNGTMQDITELEELAYYIQDSALCALGQSAPNPVISTLLNFKDEYIAHVADKKCPAKVCKALVKYMVVADKCIGCTKCKRNCPVQAISGEVKKPHKIDANRCIKCDMCRQACPVNAIILE
jgi:NADH:ubiquinone oxidoreductase subunit F (NADH-binding)/(2Fe-2S) ferredoxin/NAD-dependent dihydropyrimidine dehydrogenase PreA subunit